MVVCCCAYGCKEKHVKGGAITFHSFPQDELRRRLWQIKIRRADFTPSDHSKICSKHFTPDSFDTEKFGGTWLKKNAIPTLFNFPPDMCLKSNPKTDKLFRDFFAKQNEKPPLPPEDFIRRKRKYYIGDFTEKDMDCPEEARKMLHVAKNEIAKTKGKLKTLQVKHHRLEKKVRALQEKLESTQKQLRLKTAIYGPRGVLLQKPPEIKKEIDNCENGELS